MASVNKVIIVGNLGRDPESRTFPSGDMVTNVSIATTDRWKDKQTGEQKEATEWHRVSFHGRLAEIASQYLRQGSQVYVEGSLRTRKWTDQNGVERYSTEIRADTMQMLGQRQDGGGNGGGRGGYDNQGYDNQGDNAGRQQPQRQQGGQRSYGNQQGGQRQQPQQGQQRGNQGGQQQRGPQQNQQRQQQGGQGGYDSAPPPQRQGSGFDDMDDDIPF